MKSIVKTLGVIVLVLVVIFNTFSSIQNFTYTEALHEGMKGTINAINYNNKEFYNAITKIIDENNKNLTYQNEVTSKMLTNDKNIAESVLNLYDFLSHDVNKMINSDVYIGAFFSGGSGTVINKSKKNFYVLTCYHVIEETEIFGLNPLIKYKHGEAEISYEGEVIKVDKEHDLALVRVKGEDIYLEAVSVAKNEPLKGDTVYAVGSPLATFKRNITKGILSNYEDYFYVTDASITFGNSGGGLYNQNAELIGVPAQVPIYSAGLDAEGKPAVVPESNLGMAINLPTIQEFLKDVVYE